MSDARRPRQLGLKPQVRFIRHATAGCPPEEFCACPEFYGFEGAEVAVIVAWRGGG